MNNGTENNNQSGRGSGLDPFAGTELETGGEASPQAADPFGFGPGDNGFSDGTQAQAGGEAETGGEAQAETGGEADTQAPDSAEADSTGSQELGGRGRAVVLGDAPPAQRPVYAGATTPPAVAPVSGNGLQPARRGRPPGSKNRNPPSPPASTVVKGPESWFGGTPLPANQAVASAKAIVAIISMPCNLAARMRKDDRFKISGEEKAEIEGAFRDYMMVRGDILGYWGPEITLAFVAGMPLYARYMLWEDPESYEQLTADLKKASGAT